MRSVSASSMISRAAKMLIGSIATVLTRSFMTGIIAGRFIEKQGINRLGSHRGGFVFGAEARAVLRYGNTSRYSV